MSFVSVIARTDFICIMSDGLVRWDRSIIKEENHQKFKTYENRAFIGYVGVLENIEIVLENFKYSNFDFSNWVKVISNIYSTISIPYPEFPSSFILGGLNDLNEIEYYVFECGGSDDTQTYHKKPEANMWYLSFIPSLVAENHNLIGKFESLINETPKETASDFISAQKSLNDYVVSFSSAVNKNTKRFVVKNK